MPRECRSRPTARSSRPLGVLIERCSCNAVLASLGAEGSVLVAADGTVHVQRTEGP